MSALDKMPLKVKILSGVTLASTLAIVIASTIFSSMESTRLHETLAINSETTALIVANNAAGALAFDDRDSAHEVLTSLKENPQIMAAALYDSKGNEFATYSAAGNQDGSQEKLSKHAEKAGIVQTESYIQVTSPVLSDGEQVGSISMRVTLDGLNKVVSDFKILAVAITLGLALLSAGIALLIQRAVSRPIHNVVEALRDIAEGDGDLTQRLPVTSKDELGELASCFNNFVEKIHQVTTTFRDTAINLNKSAEELNHTTEKTNQGVIKQQSEIDQVASAITQMSGTVQEVARNVAAAAEDAEQADREATQGKTIVNQTMQSIENLAGDIESAAEVITRLQQESDNIGAVLEVIGGIAEQTNLLALNAAIEAARAGEQGRGFAVVADEVRTLASRTQSSTQEIQEMIERLQAGAKEAVQVMQKGREQASNSVEQAETAGNSLEGITKAVSVIRDMTQQIANASKEQSAVTEEINQSVVNISQVASHTAEDSRDIARGSQELNNLANELNAIISQFKL